MTRQLYLHQRGLTEQLAVSRFQNSARHQRPFARQELLSGKSDGERREKECNLERRK